MRKLCLCGSFVGATVLLSVLGRSYAGVVHVNADNNSQFQVADSTASTIWDGMTNEAGQGTINLGTPAQEAAIGEVWVRTVINGKAKLRKVKLKTSGTTLASLEPFSFPSFDGPDGVIALIWADTLKDSGVTFTGGQVLSVTAGAISQTPEITFKDGSSLGAGFPTDAAVAALPDFTGTVTAYAYDSVVVPEPTALFFVTSGAIVGVIRRRRRRS